MPPPLSDALVAPCWLLVNGLLIAAAWRCARTVFPADSLLERIMHSVVVVWGSIVAAGLLLGFAGMLSGASLLGLVGAAAAAVLARATPPAHGEVRLDWPTRGWGVVLALVLAWVTRSALVAFPTDWDTLMYHLPLVDQWLRAGDLYAPDEAIWHFPGNNELLILWLVAPFSGDFLAALGNVPSIILLVVGTIVLGRQLGLRPASCHLAGFAAAGNGIVLRQLCDNENDVAVAGLFLASLAYAYRYARGCGRGDLLWGAVCAGILAGVKYYALAYVAVTAAATLLLLSLLRGRRRAVRASVAGAVAVLLCGSYWYLRNIVVTGTPLYPLGFSDATDLLFELRGVSTFSSTLLGNGRSDVWPLLFKAIWTRMGTAHFVSFAVFPFTASWLCFSYLLLCDLSNRVAGTCRLVLGLTVLGAACAYGVTPFAVETEPGTMNTLKGAYLPCRFGLCFLTLAVLAFVVSLDDLHRKLLVFCQRGAWSRIATAEGPCKPAGRARCRLALAVLGPQALFAALIVWQLGSDGSYQSRGSAIETALIACNLLLTAMCWRLVAGPTAPLSWRVIAAAMFVVLTSCAIGWRSEQWRDGFAQHYDKHFRTRIFSKLGAEPPGTVVCSCTYQYYPFLGAHRQFSAARPFFAPTYESLLVFIAEHRSTFVAATNHDFFKNGRYVKTKAWLDAHPERFQPIDIGSWLSFYRVVPLVAKERAAKTSGSRR